MKILESKVDPISPWFNTYLYPILGTLPTTFISLVLFELSQIWITTFMLPDIRAERNWNIFIN